MHNSGSVHNTQVTSFEGGPSVLTQGWEMSWPLWQSGGLVLDCEEIIEGGDMIRANLHTMRICGDSVYFTTVS